MKMGGWIDVSAPVRTNMAVWPGDPQVFIERVEDMEKGGAANLSRLSCSVHAGTHVDAPLHFFRDGLSIDRMPVDALMGAARVIEIFDERRIEVQHLVGAGIEPGERVLFKTANSELWARDEFVTDFVHLSTASAEWLAQKKVQAVGIDYLSVAGYERNETEVHRLLLGSGVWILEGLDLSTIAPGACELLCLPLRLVGCEGAPARALLRPLPNEPTSRFDAGQIG